MDEPLPLPSAVTTSHRHCVENAGLAQIVRDQRVQRRVRVRPLFFKPAFDEVCTASSLQRHVGQPHDPVNPLAI